MKECPVCSRCYPDHVNHCPSDGDLLKFTITGEPVLDGRYQLEMRLGQGGMGVVFKARHIFLKTQHAIKIILPDLVGNDPSLATRFRQEAMAAAAVHHPNTISVTDFGIVNGTMPFLVMEFIEGPSLHEILQREKKLPPARAIEITLAVCAGVAAAHGFGIVHRDLKPLNIILKAGRPISEGVKVLDFGLAKIKSGELLGSFVAAQTQGMMGSPFYMAPEQWSDEDIDLRADIYSLGIILYQMLAGDVPFRGASVPSIMKKHLTDPPPPLSERGVQVPPMVETAVRHALAKEPHERPASVEDFMEELRAALASMQSGMSAGEAGMPTMQIGGDTLELLRQQQQSLTGNKSAPSVGSRTVAGVGGAQTGEAADASRPGVESSREASGSSTGAPVPEMQVAAPPGGDGQPAHAGETAPPDAKRAAVHLGELSEVTRVAGADTSEAQPQVVEDAESLRAEEQRRREEAEARERAEAEAKRRAAEEAKQKRAEAEAEARRLAAAEEAKRREETEAARRRQDEARERDRLEREAREVEAREREAAQAREEAEAREREEAQARERREAEEKAEREAQTRRLAAEAQAKRDAAEKERAAVEEQRRREAEEKEKREAAEERHRADVAQREREAAETREREVEAARRREADEKEKREATERQAHEAREREQREAAGLAAVAVAGQGVRDGQSARETQSNASVHTSTVAPVGMGAPAPSRTPLIILGAVVVLALLGGTVALAYYLKTRGEIVSNVNVNAGSNVNSGGAVNENTGGTQNGGASKPEMVSLPGGTFTMGRNDVPAASGQFSPDYKAWMYSQWPAHPATVKPFAIDKTEVTNAVYAEFIKATGHQPPPDWAGGVPPPGEESLPVRRVSVEDATQFAAWRSQRDGVTYRLPTEAEWEYAARGGDAARLFPWGTSWETGRANLGSEAARPVGSTPSGATPQGVQDMLGNVSEWTSSTAAFYDGNNRMKLPDADRGTVVIRGGSYRSRPDGDKPITATTRSWVAKDVRDPTLGFRLVRPGER